MPPHSDWAGFQGLERHVRPYRNGRDLTATPRNVMVIDLFGLTPRRYGRFPPAVYQWVTIGSSRTGSEQPRQLPQQLVDSSANRAPACARPWRGCPAIIATPVTAKHRFFLFLDGNILPDDAIIAIGTGDAFVLGVLSSRVHVAWALATGGRMGVGNDPRYLKTRCFEPFPFPAATAAQQAALRAWPSSWTLTASASRPRASQADPDRGVQRAGETASAGEPLTASATDGPRAGAGHGVAATARQGPGHGGVRRVRLAGHAHRR